MRRSSKSSWIPACAGTSGQTVTLVIAATAAVIGSLAVAPGLRGVTGAGLALIVFAIALVDARHFLIPNELTAAGFALGLINAVVQAPDAILAAVALAIARAVLLAAAFLGVRMAYRRWRGREGLGLGDVKLAGVAGTWLDWPMIPLAIEIAALAALALYGLRAYLGRRPLQRAARLPFGLFFAPAIWLCWLLQAWLAWP